MKTGKEAFVKPGAKKGGVNLFEEEFESLGPNVISEKGGHPVWQGDGRGSVKVRIRVPRDMPTLKLVTGVVLTPEITQSERNEEILGVYGSLDSLIYYESPELGEEADTANGFFEAATGAVFEGQGLDGDDYFLDLVEVATRETTIEVVGEKEVVDPFDLEVLEGETREISPGVQCLRHQIPFYLTVRNVYLGENCVIQATPKVEQVECQILGPRILDLQVEMILNALAQPMSYVKGSEETEPMELMANGEVISILSEEIKEDSMEFSGAEADCSEEIWFEQAAVESVTETEEIEIQGWEETIAEPKITVFSEETWQEEEREEYQVRVENERNEDEQYEFEHEQYEFEDEQYVDEDEQYEFENEQYEAKDMQYEVKDEQYEFECEQYADDEVLSFVDAESESEPDVPMWDESAYLEATGLAAEAEVDAELDYVNQQQAVEEKNLDEYDSLNPAWMGIGYKNNSIHRRRPGQAERDARLAQKFNETAPIIDQEGLFGSRLRGPRSLSRPKLTEIPVSERKLEAQMCGIVNPKELNNSTSNHAASLARPVAHHSGRRQTTVSRYYLIQPGDNWEKISENYQLSIADIMEANPSMREELVVGQRLRIPPINK